MPALISARAVRTREFWRGYYQAFLPEAVLDEVFGETTDGDASTPWRAERSADLEVEPDAVHARFDLAFPGKMRWRIELREETGYCHSVIADEFPDEVVEVGWNGPHAALPILRWEEAKCLAESLAPFRATSPVPGCFVLPLLRPTLRLADAAQADEAEALLRQAWTDTGLLSDEQRDALVAASCGVERVEWLEDPDDADCGFVTTARHSLRRADTDVARYLKMFIDTVLAAAKQPTTTKRASRASRAMAGSGPITTSVAAPTTSAPRRRKTWHEGLRADEIEGTLRGVRAYRLLLPGAKEPIRSLPPASPLDPGFDFVGADGIVYGSFYALADRLRATPAPAGVDIKAHVKGLLSTMLLVDHERLAPTHALPGSIDGSALVALAADALGCAVSGLLGHTVATYEFGAANRLVVDLRLALNREAAVPRSAAQTTATLRRAVTEILTKGGPGLLWMQPPSTRELGDVFARMRS